MERGRVRKKKLNRVGDFFSKLAKIWKYRQVDRLEIAFEDRI